MLASATRARPAIPGLDAMTVTIRWVPRTMCCEL